MSFAGDNIRNVRSKLLVDAGGNFNIGSAICIFTLNQAPSGTPNQQWRITPVPAGKNLFTIQSVLTGLYASIDGLADVDKPIVTGVISTPWAIEAVSDPWSHQVTIRVPYTDLYWNVTADVPYTKIILSKQDNTTGQLWVPFTALPPV